MRCSSAWMPFPWTLSICTRRLHSTRKQWLMVFSNRILDWHSTNMATTTHEPKLYKIFELLKTSISSVPFVQASALNGTVDTSVQVTNIVLDSLIILSAAITICTCILIVFIRLYYRSIIQIDRTAHLLGINMNISLAIGCTIMIDMYCQTLYGHLRLNVSFDGYCCQIKAYLFYVSGCAFFYSYLLESIYRLCRIVFHTRPALQSYKLYMCGIVLLWIVSFAQVCPVLLLGTFDYLPDDYHCQIDLRNIHGLLVGLFVVYLFPVSLTSMCYVWTMTYMCRRSAVVKNIQQQVNDRRDAVVLSRVFMLLGTMIASGLPTLGISLFYQLSGYLPFWSTQFQWLTTTISMCCVSMMMLLVSPDLAKIRNRPRFAEIITLQTKSDYLYSLV